MKVADDKACGQAGNGWSDTLQRTDPVRAAQTGQDRFGAESNHAGASRQFQTPTLRGANGLSQQLS